MATKEIFRKNWIKNKDKMQKNSRLSKRKKIEERGWQTTIPGSRSQTKEYRMWRSLKSRCDDVNNPRYNNYGGRGICYCNDWSTFANFREWYIQQLKTYTGNLDKISIDRIDNNGNYSPDNCKLLDNIQNTLKGLRGRRGERRHSRVVE